MEYEIGDDPQGDCDVAEADRTGGVHEDRTFDRRRKEASSERERRPQPC